MKTRIGFIHVIFRFMAVALVVLMISSCARQGDAVDRADDDDDGAPVSTATDGGLNGEDDDGNNKQDTSDRDDTDPKDNSPDDKDPRNTDDPDAAGPGAPEPDILGPDIPDPDDDVPENDDPENVDSNIVEIGAIEVRIGQTVFRLDTLLSYDDVKDLDADELAALRNSFYAARGYIFKNKEFADMFSEYDWYKPEHNDVEDLLSNRDKLNINLILKVEGKYSALYDVFSQEETPLLGFWQQGMPYVAAGYTRTYVFKDDRTVEFRENEMDGEERIRALYGSWCVLNGKLFVYYTARDVIKGGELEPATGSVATDYEIVGGALVSEDLKEPIIEMYALNFDQERLEYGDERFGVMIGGDDYYYMGEERY